MPIQPDSIRIAVVDDEPIILNVFEALLKSAHFHADCFQDGDVLVETVRQHPNRYDLLVCDIRLAKSDGIAYAEKLRAVRSDLPVLFMTGNASDDVRSRAMALGRVEFLEKPFPLVDKLKELILKFLDTP